MSSVPSGVSLLAILEGEAQGRGTAKRTEGVSSTSSDFDWDVFEECIREAVNNHDGEIHWKSLKAYLEHYNYLVIDKGDPLE